MGVETKDALALKELIVGKITSIVQFPVGAIGAPSIYFAGDSDTGIYWRATNSIALSTGGSALCYWDASGIHFNTVTSFGSTSLTLSGNDNDDASAVGVVLDNAVAMTTGGGKIASFRNATAEKAFVDKDGQIEMTALDAAPTPSANSRIIFYLDQSGNKLKVAVKYSDGTSKTGEIALT
jgi:hypothetical protein